MDPAVDIKGGLEKISDELQTGAYKSEYDFQLDIYTLINSPHDGHLTYLPDTTVQ